MAEFDRQPGGGGQDDPSPPAPSITDEVRLLIAAALEMASFELAYQTLRARLAVGTLPWIAGGAAVALALLFFAVMALVVGLLLALAPVLGHWGALGAVVGGLLVLTLIAALVALNGVRRLMALLRDGKDRE